MDQEQHTSPISRPPTKVQRYWDRTFRTLCQIFALLTIALVMWIVFEIAYESTPAMREYGLGFVTGRTWDTINEEFGVLPEIWGTLYSSLLALLIGSVFGIAVAIFLNEGFLSGLVFSILRQLGLQFHPFFRRLPEISEGIMKNLVELLAAIPSVVYGLWGIFVVIPLIRPACDWLHNNLGMVPWFSTPLSGTGLLPAALVLAVMILPTVAAISRDALGSVPVKLREASYGLGATRWETLLRVIIPTASGGIFGAIVLAFGRALGETMALAMLAGNQNYIAVSLFSPANTLAALLANNFSEATPSEPLLVGSLMYAGLVLMAITLGVNMLGTFILQRTAAAQRGLR